MGAAEAGGIHLFPSFARPAGGALPAGFAAGCETEQRQQAAALHGRARARAMECSSVPPLWRPQPAAAQSG